jgi:hypothetical protein
MGTVYRKTATKPPQRLDIADRLAAYFGLELQPTNPKGER